MLVPRAQAVDAGAATVETTLLSLINTGRATALRGPLVMHTGLSDVARSHSVDMVAANQINHNGYPDRIDQAAPDPYESNGAPTTASPRAARRPPARTSPGTTPGRR